MQKCDKVRVTDKCKNKELVGEIGIIAKIEEGYCFIIFERIWGVLPVKSNELEVIEKGS